MMESLWHPVMNAVAAIAEASKRVLRVPKRPQCMAQQINKHTRQRPDWRCTLVLMDLDAARVRAQRVSRLTTLQGNYFVRTATRVTREGPNRRQ